MNDLLTQATQTIEDLLQMVHRLESELEAAHARYASGGEARRDYMRRLITGVRKVDGAETLTR
jgi:hypothetical protein